jgi:ornithine--oxo-acid transaminase/putrescine aminotransferase
MRGSALSAGPARGVGFMVGVPLVQPDHPWVSFEQLGFPDLEGRATIGPLLACRLYKRGFFTFVCGHDWSILRLQPRFDIPEETLLSLATACREELDAIGDVV